MHIKIPEPETQKLKEHLVSLLGNRFRFDFPLSSVRFYLKLRHILRFLFDRSEETTVREWPVPAISL